MTEQPAIYGIVHRKTSRYYVGSASNLSKRWSRHRKDLRAGTHRNTHLQAAWNKYGEHEFDFFIIELMPADLDTREQFWIDELNAYTEGFNLCPVARSSRGRKWTAAEYVSRGKSAKNRKQESEESRDARSARARALAVSQRKLSLDQVAEARERYGPLRKQRRPHSRNGGGITVQALANHYGVSLGTMSQILNGKAYA